MSPTSTDGAQGVAEENDTQHDYDGIRELDNPLPPDVTNLDVVIMHLTYHDAVAMGVDRVRRRKAV